jgi:glucose-6-phosphate isomerase
MENLTLNLKNCSKFISLEETMAFAQLSSRHLDTLNSGTGVGSDFLGWLSLPDDIQSQLDRIEKVEVCGC